ncbi:amino-oxidase domain-containing protein [Favolaschia claudopus]|uniref:Amino-oxidase domain-containing protein n=1 Tax=Favolaschia claudopus TaxID=2862362 RepID=A0AAW0DC71_9AGAR
MRVAVVGQAFLVLPQPGLVATRLHLYEADDRPGGHANTVKFTPSDSKSKESVYVDTGFIVFNPSTVSRDRGVFEWAGSNLATIFCQPFRLIDPNMWRLIYDVLRFNACARSILDADTEEDFSIGDYLDREGYSDSFRDNYLIPMTACIWSTPPDKCAMDFPAKTLIQFMNNHHLLQITGKPSWLTIQGGSREYVNKILAKLPASQLHLSTPRQGTSSVRLTTSSGTTETYDHVIFGCHSDTVLSILQAGEGMTAEEEKILSMFEWNRNEAVLHSDINLMPRSRLAWSCWNYLTQSVVDSEGQRKPNSDQVSLTYGMNDLQHIPLRKFGPVLVTLNPPFEPRDGTLAGRYRYDHPVLDAQADGFASGLAAAAHLLTPKDNLDKKMPFEIETSVDRRPHSAWAAVLFFMVFEGSGMRGVVGFVGSWVLAVIGYCVGRVFGFGKGAKGKEWVVTRE